MHKHGWTVMYFILSIVTTIGIDHILVNHLVSPGRSVAWSARNVMNTFNSRELLIFDKAIYSSGVSQHSTQ